MTAVLEPQVDEIVGFDPACDESVEPVVVQARSLRVTRLDESGNVTAPVERVQWTRGNAITGRQTRHGVINTAAMRQVAVNVAQSMQGLTDALERLGARRSSLINPIADGERTRVATAVQNGICVLDATLGRDVWLARVNTKTLDLWSPFACVLAQATDLIYSDGVRHLQQRYGVRTGGASWGEKHGFVAASLGGYQSLQREWERRLAELKSA